MNYLDSPKTRKAGRPKNSVTTVKVKMADLITRLHPNHTIPIGRKFAIEAGIEFDLPATNASSDLDEFSNPSLFDD